MGRNKACGTTHTTHTTRGALHDDLLQLGPPLERPPRHYANTGRAAVPPKLVERFTREPHHAYAQRGVSSNDGSG